MTSHNNDPDVQRPLSDSVDDQQSSGAKRGRKGRAGKGRKKRRCSTGQSSASQQPVPEGKEEGLEEPNEEKSFLTAKNLTDRVDRRITISMTNMKSLISVIAEASQQFGFIVDIKRVRRQWPLLPVLENIKEEIKKIRKEIKKNLGTGKLTMELPDEMLRRLKDIEEKINKADDQLEEDSQKVKKLEGLILDGDVSMEKLKEELFADFPWLFEGENESNGHTADQDQGSLPTREQLITELFDVNNNKVDVSRFPVLKEGMENGTGQWNVPYDLEPFAIRIEKVLGKATERASNPSLLVVCAAIQEMEDLPIADLNWPTLLKWGAALNKAAADGIYVKFAENLLFKNLYAYFACLKIR